MSEESGLAWLDNEGFVHAESMPIGMTAQADIDRIESAMMDYHSSMINYSDWKKTLIHSCTNIFNAGATTASSIPKMSRVWQMPHKWTFKIPCVVPLFRFYGVGKSWVDPFAGECSPAEITNDIEGRGAKYQMDALDFLKTIDSCSGVLFDPPYSVEQCLRIYTPKQNGTAGRAEYWGQCKDEIGRIAPDTVISFGWDSTGMGKGRGFYIEEILLICHGACHNDTIVTVEKKYEDNQTSFI